jgi:hypothetical protein
MVLFKAMATRLPLPALFAAYPADAGALAVIRLASAAIDFRSGLSFCWEWQCLEGKSATRLSNGKLRRLAGSVTASLSKDAITRAPRERALSTSRPHKVRELISGTEWET